MASAGGLQPRAVVRYPRHKSTVAKVKSSLLSPGLQKKENFELVMMHHL